MSKLNILLNNRFIDETTGCWLWTGAINIQSGYGEVCIDYIRYRVHRLSLHVFKEFDLKSKLLALHILECPNRHCFNPDHLYAGDSVDNNQDTVRAGHNKEANKTRCRKGHLFSEDNTYINPHDGKRVCIFCRKLNRRKYYIRRGK